MTNPPSVEDVVGDHQVEDWGYPEVLTEEDVVSGESDEREMIIPEAYAHEEDENPPQTL